MKPADVNKMLAEQENPVNMIVEQISLGRGTYWFVLFYQSFNFFLLIFYFSKGMIL